MLATDRATTAPSGSGSCDGHRCSESSKTGPTHRCSGPRSARTAPSWPRHGRTTGRYGLIDPATGRPVTEVTGLGELPRDTALSPDGDRVAVAMGAIGAVVVYDVSTGDELFELLGHVYPPSSVAWSPDGRWIASGAYDGAVRTFDADTGALDSELPGHAGLVISVDWSPDGRRLVSGGSDGTARVWSIEGAVRREILRLSAQQTRSGTFAAFSPDGDQVMTGDAGIQAVKIWDVSRLGGEEVVNLETDQLAPVDVAYAPDGHIVAPIRTGLDRSVDRPRRPRVDDSDQARDRPTAVVNIAVNGDGTRVATGRNFSPFTTVWDTGTGETLFEFSDTKRRFNEVADLAWGPDGTHLAVSDLAGYVDVLDGRGASVAFLDAGEGTAIEGVAFGPDGRFDRGHRDRIRIPARVPRPAVGLGARGARRHLEDGGPGHADVAPDGSTLAVGTFDGAVEVWDIETQERRLHVPSQLGRRRRHRLQPGWHAHRNGRRGRDRAAVRRGDRPRAAGPARTHLPRHRHRVQP